MHLQDVKTIVAVKGPELMVSYSFIEKFLILAFLISSVSLADMALPRTQSLRKTSDILETFPIYLKYVVEAGKRSDAKSTERLLQTYAKLEKKSPEHAARFLKGLRLEINHRVELEGLDGTTVSSSNPKIRAWAGRFMKEWAREADEQLLRAYGDAIAMRDKE